MTTEDIISQIPIKKIKRLLDDPQKSAAAVNLVYVSDSQPGITRLKKGKSFTYLHKGKRLTDINALQRIQQLVIPPAWDKVWICVLPKGHLQVTGVDVRNRKQYKYHTLWNALRNHTKFYRLYQFGLALCNTRLHLEKDLALQGLPLRKVLATAVDLMEQTNIRIGNNAYAKMYGSYGITTLKDRHVTFTGNEIRFAFKGKKGVFHNISLKSKRLAAIVKKCKDIPGKELFQFYDNDGKRHPIDSGMVNDYIREISGGDFTAKDFRTWAGTVQALLAFKHLGFSETITETRKNIVAALDIVSGLLGNTRTVCKKYYVHPAIISLYESKELETYIGELDVMEKNAGITGFRVEEKVLMKILKQ